MGLMSWLLNALNVVPPKSTYTPSNLIKNTESNGLSNAAPDATMPDGNVTPKSILNIYREKQTSDATFGKAVLNGVTICETMERTAVMIPKGVYPAVKALSPHFGFDTPHLSVPGRTYIEIHPANYPSQLEGCIAMGMSLDGDALDYSKEAFEKLMAVLPASFLVSVV